MGRDDVSKWAQIGLGIEQAFTFLQDKTPEDVYRLFHVTQTNPVPPTPEILAEFSIDLLGYTCSIAMASHLGGDLLEKYTRAARLKWDSIAAADRPALRPPQEACLRMGLTCSAKQLVEQFGAQNLQIKKKIMSTASCDWDNPNPSFGFRMRNGSQHFTFHSSSQGRKWVTLQDYD